MREIFAVVLPIFASLIAIVVYVSWIMMVYWIAQFASVKSRVTRELKPFLPDIEKELGFFSKAANQNTIIPPILKELTGSHALSEKLSLQTRRDLEKAIHCMLLYRRAFFTSLGIVAGIIIFTMIAALILANFSADGLR